MELGGLTSLSAIRLAAGLTGERVLELGSAGHSYEPGTYWRLWDCAAKFLHGLFPPYLGETL